MSGPIRSASSPVDLSRCYLPTARMRSYGRMLRTGAVLAYPTEAVYGLGCDPRNAAAVARILALKQRSVRKGVILVAAEFDQLLEYIRPVERSLLETATAVWPGPVTWLWPASTSSPYWLTGGGDCVAVRISAHATVRALCCAFGGAIVSTSANRSGRTATRSSHAARACFGCRLDAVVPGSVSGAAAPSEIRDLRSGRVLRGG